MTKGMQIGLIAAAVVVFSCFGGVVFLYNKYGKEFIDNAQVAMKEGATYAANTDQNGCVAEGKSRVGTDTSGMTLLISKHAPFITECLSKSRQVAGFCDSVPDSKGQADAEEAWRRRQCEGMEINDARCFVITGAVQSYCSSGRSGRG